MLRVKINPDCFKWHRPPHCPWYVAPTYDKVYSFCLSVVWLVKEDPELKESYVVVGFQQGDIILHTETNTRFISKQDCTILQESNQSSDGNQDNKLL